MQLRPAIMVAGNGLAIAAASVVALFTVLIESQKPDMLPDWVSLASVAFLAIVVWASSAFVWRAYHSWRLMSSLVCTSFLLFLGLWSILEVVI